MPRHDSTPLVKSQVVDIRDRNCPLPQQFCALRALARGKLRHLKTITRRQRRAYTAGAETRRTPRGVVLSRSDIPDLDGAVAAEHDVAHHLFGGAIQLLRFGVEVPDADGLVFTRGDKSFAIGPNGDMSRSFW